MCDFTAMRRILLFIAILVSGKVCAQNYTRDAGFRAGTFFTIAYRQHIEEDQAFEAMVSIGRRGTTVTILKEHFQPALGRISGNLYFQYGYGAHTGFRSINHYKVLYRTYVLDEYRFTPLLGLDGLIGIEYRFPYLPIIAGIDMKPYFEYSTIQIFSLYLNNIGFSIKYRF
jgi:hypothetical protein